MPDSFILFLFLCANVTGVVGLGLFLLDQVRWWK